MSNMSSSNLFRKILFTWANHWVKERNTTFKWVGHTRNFLARELFGMFWNSKLAHITGLRYQGEDGVEHEVESNRDWQGRVCLRGYIVISCRTKVAYSDEYENVRYKWAIHISEIYADLQRYAVSNAEITPLLVYLQKQEDGDGLYFENAVIAEEALSSQEVIVTHNDDCLDSSSENSSEAPPSEDEELSPSEDGECNEGFGSCSQYEEKNSLVSPWREGFLNTKDLLSFVLYWNSFVNEIELSEELHEKFKLQQVFLLLRAMLSFLSSTFIKRLQNIDVEESNEVSDCIEYLLDRLGESKYLKYFPSENKIEYNTAIALSSVERETKDTAEDIFNQVILYLIDDIAPGQKAYNYYYLSQIALKLQKLETAKEMMIRSSEYFDKNNLHDADVEFFKKYLDSAAESSVVAVASISFFPNESSENKIVSSRPLSSRLPSRGSL